MQIHELNTFSGTPGANDYFATDNGTDTSKISASNLYAPLNARIDNIIAGPTSSAEEVVDARLGASVLGGDQYASLGDSIRGQVTELYEDIGSISGGNVVFADEIGTNTTPILSQDTTNKSVHIYTDESGIVHIKGTATGNVLKFPLTNQFAISPVNVTLKGSVSGVGGSSAMNVSLFNPSTDASVSNAIGFYQSSSIITGTLTPNTSSGNVFVSLYVRSGATVDMTITLNSALYGGKVLAPNAKIISSGLVEAGAYGIIGGDQSLVINTNIGYDRFFSMPYVYNFNRRQIDFANGSISFLATNLILSPYKYYAIAAQDVSFGTDDFVYWIVYNYDTGTISAVKSSYFGKNLVLFGLYRERILSPYSYSYEHSLAGINIGYLGDSLTYGVGAGGNANAYPELLHKHYRTNVYNYGVSGSAITEEPGVTTDSFNERVAGMVNGLDVVCFMGGTNDYWRNLHIGTITDTVNTTFYGALNTLCDALQAKYPNAFIYAVIPPMGYAPDNNFTMEPKSNIGSFMDVRTAIIEVCEKHAIPYIDFMVDSSINPRNSTVNGTFYSDGVHLNAIGQRVLANAHIDFLNKNIDKIMGRIR